MLLEETCYIKAKVNAKGQKVSEFEFKEKGLKFNVTLKAFDRASESVDLEQDERLDRAQHHKVPLTFPRCKEIFLSIKYFLLFSLIYRFRQSNCMFVQNMYFGLLPRKEPPKIIYIILSAISIVEVLFS